MAIGGVVINFVANTAKAVGNVKDLTKSLGKVDDDGTKPAKKGFGQLVGGMGKFLPVAGAVVGAVAGVGVALWESAQAAMEDKKQADNLARTLKKIPGITDAMVDSNADWIDSMELLTGIADTEWRVAISKLALATGDLNEAQKLATITADAAVGSGKNWATIQDAMAKAVDGNTTSLKRLFPWLDANKDGTITLTEAVDGLQNAYGGAAEAAADNDPFVRLGAIFDQLKESVGQALVPLIDKFGGWLGKKSTQEMIKRVIDKVTELAEAFGEKLLTAAETAIDWLSKPENQQKLKDWAALAGKMADAFVDIADAVSKLIGWLDKLPKSIPLFDLLPGGWRGAITHAFGHSTGTSAAARSGSTNVTINVTGVSDPYAAARLAAEQAAKFARVQGRVSPGVVPAW